MISIQNGYKAWRIQSAITGCLTVTSGKTRVLGKNMKDFSQKINASPGASHYLALMGNTSHSS